MLGRAVCVVSLMLLLVAIASDRARAQGSDTSQIDSSRIVPPDTTAVPGIDSGAAAPAGPKPPLFREIGAPFGSVTRLRERSGVTYIDKRDIVWDFYFTPYEVVARELPGYGLSQGGPGLVRGFSIAGAPVDAVSTLFNGRALRGPLDDAMDLELYPVEFLERIELLRGARALIQGSGEALATLNFVQPRFDVVGTYARLWYAQGPNNQTGLDVTYDRNIGERSNLTLGVRRIPDDGEFQNQNVSSWDIRGSLRWDPSDALTVSLTEIYSDAERGLNGGLTETASRFPTASAPVFVTTLDEETLRHDLTLAARWYPAPPSRTSDSVPVDEENLARFDASLYYTYAERNILLNDSIASPVLLGFRPTHIARDLAGVRVSAKAPLAFALLEANGSAELLGSGRLRLEAGGMLELPVSDLAALRGAARLHRSRGIDFLTFAGDISFQLTDSFSLFGSARQSARLRDSLAEPLDYELDDTLRAFSDFYTGFMAEGGIDWRSGGGRFSASALFRRAVPREDPDGASHTVIGGDLRAVIPYRAFRLDVRVLATVTPEGDDRFPLIDAVGDLYWGMPLLQGNLDLRLGTVLEFQSSLQGARYDNISGRFIYEPSATRRDEQLFPNWSAYARARIGSAYLRVEMRNILDAEFWTVYRYPIPARSLYLGVTWALFD